MLPRRHCIPAFCPANAAPPKNFPRHIWRAVAVRSPATKNHSTFRKWKQIQLVVLATAFCPWPSCHGGEHPVIWACPLPSFPPLPHDQSCTVSFVACQEARPTSALSTAHLRFEFPLPTTPTTDRCCRFAFFVLFTAVSGIYESQNRPSIPSNR